MIPFISTSIFFSTSVISRRQRSFCDDNTTCETFDESLKKLWASRGETESDHDKNLTKFEGIYGRHITGNLLTAAQVEAGGFTSCRRCSQRRKRDDLAVVTALAAVMRLTYKLSRFDE